MKPYNNLSVVLAYAIPTAAALLGLLWLLRRKKGEDDEDAAADTSEPALAEAAGHVTIPSTLARPRQEWDRILDSKEAAEVGRFDSGDGTLQKVDVSNFERQSTDVEETQGADGKVTSAGDEVVVKTQGSDEKAMAAGDEVSASSERTSDTQINSSLSATPDRKDSASTVHTSNDTCVLPTEKAGKPSVNTGTIDSVLKEDPVQFLVCQSEEKLKEDDAAIVQVKLSHSTLQSVKRDSSKSTFGCSSHDCEHSVHPNLPCSSQEPVVLKEVAEEVVSQASHLQTVQSAPAGKVSSTLPSKSLMHPESSDFRILKPVVMAAAEGRDLRKDTQQGSTSRIGVKSLEPKSAESVAFNPDTPPNEVSSLSSKASWNSNSSSSAPLPSAPSSESEVVESRVKTVLQEMESDSEQKNVQILSKDEPSARNEAAKDSKSNTDRIAANGVASQGHPASEETAAAKEIKSDRETPVSENTKPTTDIGETKDAKLEETATTKEIKSGGETQVSENVRPTTDIVATKGAKLEESAATREIKSDGEPPVSKNVKPTTDIGESKGAKLAKEQAQQANAASSVISSPPTSSAKVSPHKQALSNKQPTTSERSEDGPSKVSHQQKSKSSPSPSNSYSSKRRVKSGSSDRTRDGHDSVTVSQTSSEVSENGKVSDSSSPICDTNSEASNDSGRGGSVGDTLVHLSAGEVVRFEFNFPSDLCGRLIGRGGKNIQHIKEQSGATVTLSSNPFTPEFQICRVQGLQAEVDRALMMIRKKFPQAQHPLLDMASLTPPPPTSVVLPEIMQHALQLNLPEGVSIDIVVSAIVNAGHIFVQQPTHPTFPSLERLSHFMNACYSDQNAPMLPRPVEGGIICAAESEGQWYRAQVVQVYPHQDECDIKYVDYGGYTRVPINSLKQIRSDFMTLPFQAVECFLANITPLQDEEYFSDKASDVLMELTSGKMLQGQVICRGDDSFCYVHLYQVSGHSVLLINREMVNREVVRWIEIL